MPYQRKLNLLLNGDKYVSFRQHSASSSSICKFRFLWRNFKCL